MDDVLSDEFWDFLGVLIASGEQNTVDDLISAYVQGAMLVAGIPVDRLSVPHNCLPGWDLEEFCASSFGDIGPQCFFRFEIAELRFLAQTLLPPVVSLGNGGVCSSKLALAIYLYQLSYPRRLSDAAALGTTSACKFSIGWTSSSAKMLLQTSNTHFQMCMYALDLPCLTESSLLQSSSLVSSYADTVVACESSEGFADIFLFN